MCGSVALAVLYESSLNNCSWPLGGRLRNTNCPMKTEVTDLGYSAGEVFQRLLSHLTAGLFIALGGRSAVLVFLAENS